MSGIAGRIDPTRPRLKHWIEYGFLLGVCALFRALPHGLALRAGVILAWLIHRVGRFRVGEAKRRIRQVMGEDLPAPEVRRIAWISFRNMVLNAVEVVRYPKLDEAWIEQHVDAEAMVRSFRQFTDRGQGVIAALVHMGNWDLSGLLMEQLGIAGVFIARNQKNPLSNRLMNRLREQCGSVVLDRDDPGLVHKSLRALNEGRLLAILIDLRNPTEALNVEYLGHRANLGAGLGLLARMSGAPVMPVILSRKGLDSHIWRLATTEPLYCRKSGDKHQDWLEVVQQVATRLSAGVKAHPDQYFWYNKRWVLEPLKPDSPEAPHS